MPPPAVRHFEVIQGDGLEPMSREERTDEELMVALGQDQQMMLDLLLGRHWSAVVRFASGYVQSADAAEDIAQEAFVRLWQQRHSWKSTGSVRSFLYRVARNLALNETRSRRIRLLHRERAAAALMPEPTAVSSLEADDVQRRVDAAVAALPERRREIFILARHHDLSYAEIAETLGISPQTVANQMSAALATLREGLKDLVSD